MDLLRQSDVEDRLETVSIRRSDHVTVVLTPPTKYARKLPPMTPRMARKYMVLSRSRVEQVAESLVVSWRCSLKKCRIVFTAIKPKRLTSSVMDGMP